MFGPCVSAFSLSSSGLEYSTVNMYASAEISFRWQHIQFDCLL
jgi:hypothetical protein